MTESGSMLMEMPFDMEAKLVEKILLTLVNFLIPLLINLIVLYLMGVRFDTTALLFLPALLPLILLGIAFGVFISLIEVVFNDILIVASQGITLLMYFTPVVYTDRVESPFLQQIIAINPLTYLLGVPRDLLIGSTVIHWQEYFISAGIALLVFLAVIHFFFKSVYKIVERIFD